MSSYFAEPERYELSESARYVFRPTRRGFLLGAGLLILAIEESLNGQTPQERPRLHAATTASSPCSPERWRRAKARSPKLQWPPRRSWKCRSTACACRWPTRN